MIHPNAVDGVLLVPLLYSRMYISFLVKRARKGVMINSLVLKELSWPLQIDEHKTSKIPAGQCSTIPGYTATADVSIQAIQSRGFQTDAV